MKPFAVFLVILVIAALIGVGWYWYSSRLSVTFSSCIVTDPVTQENIFNELKTSLENDTFTGTRYSASPLTLPSDYVFYTWTVHLENETALPVSTIEIQITPISGDAVLLGDPSEHVLDAHSSGDLSATVLTARNTHSVREAVITWYVWGLPFSTRITVGN